MFENVVAAPPDAILGITEAFNRDPNPKKINLSVGIYKDKDGKTPVLATVKEAERRLLEQEKSKTYKPISGDPEYGRLVRALMFGSSHALVGDGRAVTAHTPGGTGALRVIADYLHKTQPSTTVWMSDPTWNNHPSVFEAAQLQVKTYPYFAAAQNALDFAAMMDALSRVPAGDSVLLHACCHNPSGVDLNPAEWGKLATLLAERKIFPIVDFAYQGFGDGLTEDAVGLNELLKVCPELAICSSFSKNFGLYNERTGALTVVAKTADDAERVLSQIKVCVRVNYSNPPAHGSGIVETILKDAELAKRWEAEVTEMRDRINGMRVLFVDSLKQKGAKRDFSFLIKQRGMFSFSGLNKDQVATLRDKFGIYIVGSGRINVAGMTQANMGPLCEAVASVL
jgi:aspartate aminotransferase